MDIGFIGLGRMGVPMARRLIEAGHKLVVFDELQGRTAPKAQAQPAAQQNSAQAQPTAEPPAQAGFPGKDGTQAKPSTQAPQAFSDDLSVEDMEAYLTQLSQAGAKI